MTLKDYPKFFSALARLFVTDPDAFLHFRSSGFRALDWPACDGRTVACEFERLSDERSVEFAKLSLKARAAKLENPTILPERFDEIWALALEMANFGRWELAGMAIAKDPSKGEQIALAARLPVRTTAVAVQDIILAHVEEQTRKMQEGKPPLVEIPGWTRLSRAIDGFNPGRVYLLVADTGAGKTTFALNLASSAANGFPTLFVNMEMPMNDMLDRLLQLTANAKPDWKAEQRTLDGQAKMLEAVSSLQNRQKLFLTDGRAMTLDQISGTIMRHRESDGIRLVFVDYDQKIRSGVPGDEWRAILSAVESLEEVAKVTETAIVILAQGDENGDPRASRRSKQPCSAVLALSQVGNETYVESRKNRFGAHFKIKIKTNLENYVMQEGERDAITDLLPPPPQAPPKSFKNFAESLKRRDTHG